mgnify:CR=1 FL=1
MCFDGVVIRDQYRESGLGDPFHQLGVTSLQHRAAAVGLQGQPRDGEHQQPETPQPHNPGGAVPSQKPQVAHGREPPATGGAAAAPQAPAVDGPSPRGAVPTGPEDDCDMCDCDIGEPDDDGDFIDLRRLLNVINARLMVLRGRDACIGHAYLTLVTDLDALRTVFRDRLIPLLQEYFYEDWAGKIGRAHV